MNYERIIKEIKKILDDKISDEDKCYYIELLFKTHQFKTQKQLFVELNSDNKRN